VGWRGCKGRLGEGFVQNWQPRLKDREGGRKKHIRLTEWQLGKEKYRARKKRGVSRSQTNPVTSKKKRTEKSICGVQVYNIRG